MFVRIAIDKYYKFEIWEDILFFRTGYVESINDAILFMVEEDEIIPWMEEFDSA